VTQPARIARPGGKKTHARATHTLPRGSLDERNPPTPLATHAPTLRFRAHRPVCWPPDRTYRAVQGDILRFLLVSRASNRRPPASAGEAAV